MGRCAAARSPARPGRPAGSVEQGEGELPTSLRGVFDDVDAAHLITGAGDEWSDLATGSAIVTAATRAGVSRFTVLSGWTRGTVEDALDVHGCSWTLLQPNGFMANTLSWAEELSTTGALHHLGDQLGAMVDERDIAAVAAAVLLRPHRHDRLLLTGPEALTPAGCLHELSRSCGTELHLVGVSEAEERRRRQAGGDSPQDIDFAVELALRPPAAATTVHPDIPLILGRPAGSYARWATDHASRFRPQPRLTPAR